MKKEKKKKGNTKAILFVLGIAFMVIFLWRAILIFLVLVGLGTTIYLAIQNRKKIKKYWDKWTS